MAFLQHAGPDAITDLEQLRDRMPLSRLLAWNAAAVQGAKLDRGELSIYIDRSQIRETVEFLKNDPETACNFLSDVTCVDYYPSEPRFEVIYHLLSMKRKERLRLKVRLSGEASVESLYSVWPSCDYFEREVFDLFGVRFIGHPDLRRIQMPDDWKGHPLRKDYPVEGYR